jgi:hypothetical protein
VEVRLWKSTASLDDGGATCASPADPVACRVADLVQVGTITTTQKSTFSFKFARPLAAGEIVEVCPVEEDSSPLHAMNSSCARSMVQRLGWGPVTAQFTLGTLFSQKNSETSGTLDKVSAYAALNVSNSWFELKRCGGCPGSTSGGREKRGLAYTLQTFFEARLTQAGTSGENPADLASNLVISKTSGLFQTGAFFPWMVNSPEAYKLFVAPLGKIGFQAIPDGYALKYKTTTDASGKTVVQTDASGSPTVDEKSTIAPLWAAGVRFGLIELACRRPGSGGSDSSRRASGRQCRPARLISYLDVLWGQFDNYRVADPAAGSTSSPGRLAVEGRLAAPDLPFELGFDVNLRAGHPSQKPHDYRVFVALRWDAGRALRMLFGSSIPASDSSQQ